MLKEIKKYNLIKLSWIVLFVGILTCVIVAMLGLLYFSLTIIWVYPFFILTSIIILFTDCILNWKKKEKRYKTLINLVIQIVLHVLFIVLGFFLTMMMFNAVLF